MPQWTFAYSIRHSSVFLHDVHQDFASRNLAVSLKMKTLRARVRSVRLRGKSFAWPRGVWLTWIGLESRTYVYCRRFCKRMKPTLSQMRTSSLTVLSLPIIKTQFVRHGLHRKDHHVPVVPRTPHHCTGLRLCLVREPSSWNITSLVNLLLSRTHVIIIGFILDS